MSDRIRSAALLATGDEIVGGRTVDTNSSYLADKLAGLGIEVVSIMAVSDDVDRIGAAWKISLAGADLVISTGGLGPTSDDLTSETVARVAGVELLRDDRQVGRIREIFERRGRPMPDNNLRQALIPAGAEVIDNLDGTAPGYRLRIQAGDGRRPWGVVLPGVPREMKAMFETAVLPWIAECTDPGRVIAATTFQTFGLPESALDELLRGAVPASEGRLAFRASFPKISVRVSVTGTPQEAPRRLATLAEAVRARLGGAVYAEGDASMEQVVGDLLTAAKKSLATAESCTGGLIGSRLTDVAGSSVYYRGGLVAYSNDLKQRLLGVDAQTLRMHGAVSEETAREMAIGAARVAASDIAIATTGIAGPTGGTADKPVGTVAIALATRSRDGGDSLVDSRMYRFWGGREWVKTLTSQVALDWVRRHLLGLAPLEPETLSPRRAAAGPARNAQRGGEIS